jgi:hypothetical protein
MAQRKPPARTASTFGVAETINRRDALEKRLDDGWEKIELGIDNGADVAAWETFWVTLLHEYEAVCDDLMNGER